MTICIMGATLKNDKDWNVTKCGMELARQFWSWPWHEQTLELRESKSKIRSATFLAKLNWIVASTAYISRFGSGP